MAGKGPVLTDGDQILLAIHRSRQKRPTAGRNPLILHSYRDDAEPPELPVTQKSSEEILWEKINSKQYLPGALRSQYGLEARAQAVSHYKDSNKSSRLIDEVLDARLLQHVQHKEKQAVKLRELNAERAHLMDERERLKKKKKDIGLQPSPSSMSSVAKSTTGSASSTGMWDSSSSAVQARLRLESAQSVHGVESFINITDRLLPAEIAKHQRHRAEYQREWYRLHRPYNGELGPQSYKPWQMDHYYMVRSIVEDVVDQFLDLHFRSVHPTLDANTAQALYDAESREWEQRRLALTEQKAVQLIMEELVLETTSSMVSETVNEFLELWMFVKGKVDTGFMKTAEQEATKTDDGRDPSDVAYNLITKTYFNLQKERKKHRSSTWHHTQHVHIYGPSGEAEGNVQK